MAAAGVVFAASPAFAGSGLFLVLLVTATIGVLSPSGAEVGPFLPIEQASLTEVTPSGRRTSIYAWYNLTGSVATAVGALIAGLVVGALLGAGWSDLDAYRLILLSYAIRGLVLIPIVRAVSPAVEVPPVDTSIARRLGLHRSRGIVARLASLFALDAFGGGLIVQSLLAFWFHERFGVPEPVLGAIFFGANILAAVSALAAARIAARIGLINTMVFTHLPSNVLLMLVPLMPTVELAILVLLARFSISQMDVPDPPELHDGDRRSRRAVGRGGRHGHRAHDRRRTVTADRGAAVRRAGSRRPCRSSSRRPEDHLRPGAVARVPATPTAGGAGGSDRGAGRCARPGASRACRGATR